MSKQSFPDARQASQTGFAPATLEVKLTDYRVGGGWIFRCSKCGLRTSRGSPKKGDTTKNPPVYLKKVFRGKWQWADGCNNKTCHPPTPPTTKKSNANDNMPTVGTIH